MGGCGASTMKDKQKLGTWLKNKLSNAFGPNHKPSKHVCDDESRKQGRQGLGDTIICSPLDANNPTRRKHTKPAAAAPPAQAHGLDDCSQARASSDQTVGPEPSTAAVGAAAARLDDHLLSSQTSEQASEVSLPESVRAASAHMAMLRKLLVTHISETHDAGTLSSSLAHLQLQQQQPAGMAGQRHGSHLAAGQPSKADPLSRQASLSSSGHSPRQADRFAKQVLTADQMQLLELVQTLISDHRVSLLEQQRLQQQLGSVQEALQAEKLDKDRAAALADVRSEEAQRAQSALVSTVAEVQHLKNKRTISGSRIKLPPSHSSSSSSTTRTGGVTIEEGAEPAAADTERNEASEAGAGTGGGAAGQSKAAASTSQHKRAAKKSRQPPTAEHSVPAAATHSSHHGHGSMPAGSIAGDSSKCAGLHQARSNASSASIAPSSAVTRAGHTHAAEARGKGGAVPSAAATAGNLKNGRRLLGSASSTSGSRVGSATGQEEQAPPAAIGTRQQQGRNATQQTAAQKGPARPQKDAAGSAAPPASGPGTNAAFGSAAGSAAAMAANPQTQTQAKPSAASNMAQAHASALEQMLAERLGASLAPNAQQQMLGCSLETLASSLSVAGDSAMVGLTKQQLHLVLQRPWLQEELSAASVHAAAAAEAAAAAAAAAAAGSTHGRVIDAGAQAGGSAMAVAAAEKPKQCGGPVARLLIEAAHDSQGGARSSTGSTSGSDSSVEACSLHGDGGSGSGRSSLDSPELAEAAAGAGGTAAQVHAHDIHAAAVTVSTGHDTSAAAAVDASMPAGMADSAQLAACASSNNSSWPGMKASLTGIGASSSGLPKPQEPLRASPEKKGPTSTRLRGRSRAQPQQLESLESAAPLPLQGPVGDDGSIGGAATVALHMQDSVDLPAACAWSNDTSACAQEKQQQQSRMEGVGAGRTHLAAGQPSQTCASTAAAAAASSCSKKAAELKAAEADAVHPKQRRRWAAPSPVAEEDMLFREAQRQQQPQQQQQQRGHQRSQHQSAGSNSAPEQASVQQASSKQLQQLATAEISVASSGELSGATSDITSVASAATGCTTLSALAGVYLQHPSKPVKPYPRPSCVPPLQLQVVGGEASPPAHVQQGQQQGQQHHQQGVAVHHNKPAGEASTGSHQQQLPQPPSSRSGLSSARSLLTAQEVADMAPLMAQPNSSRNRRQSSVSAAAEGSDSKVPAATAAKPCNAPCSNKVSSSEHGTAHGSPESAEAAAGQQLQRGLGASAAGRTAGGARACRLSSGGGSNMGALRPSSGSGSNSGAYRPSSGGGSNNGACRPSSGGGSNNVACRPSSGGGSNNGAAGNIPFWGSSFGSFPASEEHSRQPTPRASDHTTGAPAGTCPNSRRASRPSSGGSVAAAAAANAAAADNVGTSDADAGNGQQTVPLQLRSSTEGSSSRGGAAGAAPSSGHSAGGGVVLNVGPPPCMASAAAAAASSFMTKRPAHLYRSISTVYAMYSPLMGNLRALGHNRTSAGNATNSSSNGICPAAAGSTMGQGPDGSISTAQVPAFAGLAAGMTALLTAGTGPGGLPAANLAATDLAAEAGVAHECHWQALLLHGCPPVPEDAALQWVGETAAAVVQAAAAEGGADAAAGASAAADEQPVALAAISFADDAQQQLTVQNAGSIATSQHRSQTRNAQAVLPQQQHQHREQQQEQQQELVADEKDVVQRGRVYPPPSLNISGAGSRGGSPTRQHMSSPTRLSPLAVAAAAAVMGRESTEAGSAAIAAEAPLLTAAGAGRPVGPLTAASPTRNRRQASHSSSNGIMHGPQQQQPQQSTATHRRQQQQTRQESEQQQQQQQDHSAWQQQRQPRLRALSRSPSRAAAIEAAAASVAAHVAAAAELINRQDERLSAANMQLPRLQVQTQQQQLQHNMPSGGADPGSTSLQVQTQQPGSPVQQQQQEQQQPDTPLRLQMQQRQQQQQQQPPALDMDCSLCCLSPGSACGAAPAGWLTQASPAALVAAASATVDTLIQQAELLGMQCCQHRLEEQQHPQTMLLQQQQPQQQKHYQHVVGISDSSISSFGPGLPMSLSSYEAMPPPAARPAQQRRGHKTPGSSRKRHKHLHQHRQHQQHLEAALEAAAAEQQYEQYQLQYGRGTPVGSRNHSRSHSRNNHRSSQRSGHYSRAATPPPLSPGGAADEAGDIPEELMVTSYQNPLLAFEAAGLPDLDTSLDTALVSAALMPGLVAAQQGQGGRSAYGGYGGLGSVLCDASGGVSAAAVPVHMTPLAKERSLRVAAGQQQAGGLAREASGPAGCGGQLHWNPLYNPNLASATPVTSIEC